MAAALRRAPGIDLRFTVPAGGFYIWCELPKGVDSTALMARAASHGVSVLPGRACFPADPPTSAVRLNFTHCPVVSIADGVGRLVDAVRETAASSATDRESETATSPVV
jgi:2-aminoadipate transaminase